MTEMTEQELHEFMRLKHHSHGLKNQQFGLWFIKTLRLQVSKGFCPVSRLLSNRNQCEMSFANEKVSGGILSTAKNLSRGKIYWDSRS